MPARNPPRSRARDTTHPIRVVARLTGLSLDTLRAWERRYEAVRPIRGARGRLYSDADVSRLKALGSLVRSGHAIGTVAGLDDLRLRRLLEQGPSVADRTPSAPVANLQTISTALDAYHLDAVEQTLNTFAVLLPPRDLIFTVVLPLLRDVGRRWERGELRPAQEHVISAIVRSVLGGLLRAASRPAAAPAVVFATPAGERHELGLLSAAVLAATSGIGVVYLGPDVPAVDIAHAASTTSARGVVLALTAPGVVSRADLRALARLSHERDVWAGGARAARLSRVAGSRVRLVDDLESFLARLADRVR